MPEFITLEEAARITGFPSQEIQQWAISKKITSYVVKQGVRLVDLTNLREFISHIERMGIQKLYLQLIIQDKEEEINEIISQFDDYLFCLRSLKNISPLLKLIIAELSTFIHDKKSAISIDTRYYIKRTINIRIALTLDIIILKPANIFKSFLFS